ncbi:MAG: hypothetical protein ACYCQI_16895 [Gammaproteobacteria bacterium]
MTQTQIEEHIQKKSNKKKYFSHTIANLAGSIISKKGYVSTIDLFLEMGWLQQDKLNDWKHGKISYLERVITANLSKISKVMKELKSWAIHSKLKPSFTVYKHKSHRLRFSKTGQLNIETAYSTHYILIKTDQK